MEALIFPVNYATWTYGSVAILLFALRNFRLYKRSQNQLHLAFAKFMTAIGFGLMMYAAWPLFVRDLEFLRISTAIGDFLMALSFIYSVQLMRLLGQINKTTSAIVSTVTAVAAVAILVLGIVNNQMVIASEYVLYHQLHGISAILFSALFIGLLVPPGLLFVKKGFSQPQNETKTILFGVIFILVALVSAFNYGIMQGQDSLASAAIITVAFTGLLGLSLSPVTQKTVQRSPLRQSMHTPAPAKG